MNHLRNIGLALLICAYLPGISQDSQDKWLKRKWNDMIAHYNIYFNATQKLDKSIDELAEKQKDDFEEVLKVYPYGTEKDAKALRPAMEEVMKKASMVIQNKPRSKWADDAYFVIGQSHFFKGDYYAAIEAFQFVNRTYKEPNIQAMAQLWLMKSYMQQERYNDAEAILGLLKENKSTDRDFLTHRSLTAGDLLVEQNKVKPAIREYQKGLRKLKDKRLAYRTHFVLGQLYLNTEQYRKASIHFEKVQKLNAPYDYVFQSNLGMAKATAETGGAGAQKTKKYLKRMLNDDKNIEFFDQIYYELAKMEFNTGNEKDGLTYMNNSASSSKGNTTQRTKTYLFLANYYFKTRNYTKAQAYYDSTVGVLPKDFPDAHKIEAKHGILSTLIQYIETIRTQDSLLQLASLDREVLDKRIDKFIEEEAERKAEEDELRKIEAERALMNPTPTTPGGPASPSGGTWYFYNTSTVARGYNDFVRRWGSRQNTDWWRFVNKSVTETAVPKTSNPDAPDADPDTYVSNLDKDQQEAIKNVGKDKLSYYENIPFSETAKEVANNKIQDAMMGIGKIYFDDLKEFAKTKVQLEQLLKRYVKTVHRPEALFYLAQSESELGNTAAYNKIAAQVAKEYPETNYNRVLNATEIVEDTKDKEVIALYATMYEAYEKADYDGAIGIKNKIETDYPGNSIQAKIDYLYALIIGKTKGKEAYIKELKIIADDYTGNEVGDIAAYTLRLLLEEDSPDGEKVESDIFEDSKDRAHYYVISGKTTNENAVKVKINEYNNKFYSRDKLNISSTIIGGRQLFFMRQFKQGEAAMKYHRDLIPSQDFLKKAGLNDISIYAISETNFRKLVKEKNEKEYMTYFMTTYN